MQTGGFIGAPVVQVIGPPSISGGDQHMSWVWRQDNEFELLENGEEYFPAVFKAIDGARDEVIIETFILFDDKVGRALRETLIRAGRRGVQVDVTVDGYGTDTLPPEFIQGLLDAGVRFHVYDPRPR